MNDPVETTRDLLAEHGVAVVLQAGPDVLDVAGTLALTRGAPRVVVIARDPATREAFAARGLEHLHLHERPHPLTAAPAGCPPAILKGLAEDSRVRWGLFLDADERISELLREELGEVLRTGEAPPPTGLRLHVERFRGGIYTRRPLASSVEPRLVSREGLEALARGEAPVARSSDREEGEDAGARNASWPRLEASLIHLGRRYLTDELRQINRVTSLVAPSGGRARPLSWLLGAGRTFLGSYFFRGGLREGVPGFLISALLGFEHYLENLKAWEKSRAE